MAIRPFNPTEDGPAVDLTDGATRTRRIRFESGDFTPPKWVRLGGGSGRVERIGSLPYQLTSTSGSLELLSAPPGGVTYYVRRDNVADRMADFPTPSPVGLTRTMYVDAQSPTNGTGTTAIDPMNTLNSLNTACRAGDDWRLKGSFPVGQPLHLGANEGTATEYLRVRNEPGEVPVLRGGPNGGSVNVHMFRKSWIWIEGLELEGQLANGGGGTYPLLFDECTDFFVIDCRSHNGETGGWRGLAAQRGWIQGLESFRHGNLAGNGGDCINLSPDGNGNSTDDLTFVFFYCRLAGHATIQLQVNVPGAQMCTGMTFAHGVGENPHAGGFNNHQNYQGLLATRLVFQNIGTDEEPGGGIGSKVGHFGVGDGFRFRFTRMRNVRREMVKLQASSHLGIQECYRGHVHHVTGDRCGWEALSVIQSSGGNEAVDMADCFVQHCFFTNANCDERSFINGSTGGNGASGRWTPLLYAAWDTTTAQFANVNRWDSGDALCSIFVDRTIFAGMTSEAVVGWTLVTGSIYKATMPNKFQTPEDADSPESTAHLSQRLSYSGEMVFEDGQTLTRRTSQGAMVGAGEFWNDDATGELYVWCLDGADPATHEIRYGRSPAVTDFMAFNPRSGTPGGWQNRDLAAAQTKFVELTNNEHLSSAHQYFLGAEDGLVGKSATWGFAGVDVASYDALLAPDESKDSTFKNMGVPTLGKASIGITEFNISTEAGSVGSASGFEGSDPDVGCVEAY